jgi:maleate isomerase
MTKNEVHRNMDPWHLGWRAKIGVIMPSVEEGHATYEYRTLFPEGVSLLETRVMCLQITPEELKRGRDEVLHAAEMLATAKADVIVYAQTAATYVWGVSGDKAIIDEIEKKTGVKATTGASSVMAALKALGIKKMLVFSPYGEEVVKMGIKFYEDKGIRVAAYECIGYTSTYDIYRVPPWEAYRGVMNLYRKNPDVDGIFLSGGGMRILPIIETLEKDTGLPVVGTTTANVWRSLQLAGIKESISGFGKLLAMPT